MIEDDHWLDWVDFSILETGISSHFEALIRTLSFQIILELINNCSEVGANLVKIYSVILIGNCEA